VSGPTRAVFVPHWLGDYDVRLRSTGMMLGELFNALFAVLGQVPRTRIYILSVGVNDSHPLYRYDGPPLARFDPDTFEQVYGWRP
jgi:hypothetical protein